MSNLYKSIKESALKESANYEKDIERVNDIIYDTYNSYMNDLDSADDNDLMNSFGTSDIEVIGKILEVFEQNLEAVMKDKLYEYYEGLTESDKIEFTADGYRRDTHDMLLDAAKKNLTFSLEKARSLKDVLAILDHQKAVIEEELYNEEDGNVQAMDIINEFKAANWKDYKMYEEALNDISALENDNMISKDAYDEYIKELQDAYNNRRRG